jgi:hypothetical protein
LEVVPYWVIIPYGFVERLVILDFVCAASDIKIKRLKLVIASLVGLFLTLAIRAVFQGNYFVTALSSIISTVAIVWIFTGLTGVRVWVSSTTAIFIITMFEFLLFSYATEQLLKTFDFIFVWILTGIPHIAALFVISLFIKRVKGNYAMRKEETT